MAKMVNNQFTASDVSKKNRLESGKNVGSGLDGSTIRKLLRKLERKKERIFIFISQCAQQHDHYQVRK
jgi:hypothetical protein